MVTATADYGDGNPISASMNVIVAEGKMNDSFEFMNSWENLTDNVWNSTGWKIRVF